MSTLHIELSEQQREALDSLSKEKGKSPESIMQEALRRLLDEHDLVDWKAALTKLEGIWEGRTDLPDFREIRRGMDRNPWNRE